MNGLRDDDAESFYDSRRSFASEYSGEGVKVFFKEHGRKGSRGSNASFLSRKKHLQPSSSNRDPQIDRSIMPSARRRVEIVSEPEDLEEEVPVVRRSYFTALRSPDSPCRT